MVNPLFSLQTFLFDTIHNLVVIIVALLVYRKTRELYKLSLQRGIYYFSNAMIFYLISYTFRYISIIFNFLSQGTFITTFPGLIVNFFNIYGAAMGGFYLAYSLCWRKFERTRAHFSIAMLLFIIGLIISLTDTYLLVAYGITQFYIFFITMILVLSLAIISNWRRRVAVTDMAPFLSLVGLSLGVYVVIFIEVLLLPFLYTIHFYSSAITMVFALAFLYNVLKITKG